MKIVVLCGGLSTERNISFLSGTKVCRALRKRGHQAVLVDLFMGLEDVEGEPAELFKNLPPLKDLTFDGSAPDLKAVRKARKWKSPSLFGKGVLEICREADIVFVALHGMNGEDGRVQATFDMLKVPGGKRLVYTHVNMPMTAIEDFAEKGKTDPFFAELDRLCSANNGLWCKAAEDYLLAHAPKVEIGEPKELVKERIIRLQQQ